MIARWNKKFRIISRLFRAITDMTMEEEAEYLGISKSLLCRYENSNQDLGTDGYSKFYNKLCWSIETYHPDETELMVRFGVDARQNR